MVRIMVVCIAALPSACSGTRPGNVGGYEFLTVRRDLLIRRASHGVVDCVSDELWIKHSFVSRGSAGHLEMDNGVGLSILVENSVQRLPEVLIEDRFHNPAVVQRQTGNELHERAGATVFSISAVNFCRQLITSVAAFITRIRRWFFFRLANGGIARVGEGDGRTRNVQEADSEACEPQLTEIVFSDKETASYSHSKLLDCENFESNCSTRIKADLEQSVTCDDENATHDNGDACQIQFTSPSASHLQTPAISAICESALTLPSELIDGHSLLQHDECDGQDASREAKLRDDENRNKFLTSNAPSGGCDAKPETCGEESIIENVAASKSVNKKFSIHQINAMVAEKLIKFVQALESSMVPAATLTQKATHWQAIILATLVAVAVWARNSKHLHESMPCIRGSRINVHIRSRL